jgi:hypothetical protein
MEGILHLYYCVCHFWGLNLVISYSFHLFAEMTYLILNIICHFYWEF